MSVYTDMGYKNRRVYLQSLANEHGLALSSVVSMAVVYGKDEDFDGLVTSVEDYAESFGGAGEAEAVELVENSDGLLDFVSRETKGPIFSEGMSESDVRAIEAEGVKIGL